jgi:hypothetical protein
MSTPSASGFAAVIGDEIVVRTVSATARAAKVNALVVVFGVMVRNDWTDAQIEAAWRGRSRSVPVEVVPVRVVTA